MVSLPESYTQAKKKQRVSKRAKKVFLFGGF